MYQRTATSLVTLFATQYPCIGITGPRQSGKTTLAKQAFPHHPYVSFENVDTRRRAEHDWRTFLASYPQGAIFDEVHHVPELFSFLQGIVDENDIPGQFILISSQNFQLNKRITQSLAGRIGLLTLLPLSLQELGSDASLYELILNGGYPRLHVRNINPHQFYLDYLTTYIERDVRQIKNEVVPIRKITQLAHIEPTQQAPASLETK